MLQSGNACAAGAAHLANYRKKGGAEMPYKSIADLPDSVRDNVPKHAQEIYKEAFNSAFDEYKERGAEGREETAHKVAWSAVKKKYRKDEKSGKWELAE
jgi:cation transport regulator